MAELLIRASALDTALIEDVVGRGRAVGMMPHRIVVDAHVARSEPGIGAAAGQAGIPFIVDPQTHLIQDSQPETDRWARLQLGPRQKLTSPDLSPSVISALVERGID